MYVVNFLSLVKFLKHTFISKQCYLTTYTAGSGNNKIIFLHSLQLQQYTFARSSETLHNLVKHKNVIMPNFVLSM